MLLGLATYLYGYRYLPARVERRKFESATRLTATERRIVVALIAVMIISIFESIAYGQVFNVSSIWIQQHVALDLGGFRIPVPWFQSINSVFSIASVPLLFWIWRQQALRGREPNELAKIGTGAFLAAASNLILGTGNPPFERRAGSSTLAIPLQRWIGNRLFFTTGPRFSPWFRAPRRPK